MINKLFPIFNRFLKENDLYSKFYENVSKEKDDFYEVPIETKSENYKYDFISSSFSWRNSKEGAFFWLKIHQKWTEFYYKYIIDNYMNIYGEYIHTNER